MDTSSSAEPVSSEQECPLCKGARFVHPLLANGKPDYSRMVPCRCANQEAETKRTERLQKYSNLGSLTRLTFANLAPEGNSKEPASQEQFHRAYDQARAFAQKPEGWLVFTGPSGCGKTHLAVAIVNQCIENNVPAFYITASDLLDHLRASFSPTSEMPYDEFFEQIRNTAILVLDDFGSQSSTPWAKEKLDQLLSHRYNNRLPTVIVSTVPIDELEERVRTRLANTEFCRIHTLGSSLKELSQYNWAPGLELQKRMTFENFITKRGELTSDQRQNLENAYELAHNFADSPGDWIVFAGENGCGKTHLAAAIVNYRYKLGKPALFIVVPDFLDHLRSTFSPDSKISYDELFESVRNTELLILDDFGEQASTPWAKEKLYQVINYRYNARSATVVTTSCALDDMDNRIASRLGDHKISTLFNINAPDYRVDQHGKKKTLRSSRKTQ
ncbi:MAG: ATP-binding protein [Dehalococcoidales bacterium]|nr:ATP-binding protein [Dehalococcoidales bacterium]